jgi:transglutaminase-like putative cysteine protease
MTATTASRGNAPGRARTARGHSGTAPRGGPAPPPPSGPRRASRRTAAIAAGAALLAVAAELPLLRVFGSPGLRMVLMAAPPAALAAAAVRQGLSRVLRTDAASALAVPAGFVAGLAAGAVPGIVAAAPDPFGPTSLSARLQQALTDGWYRLLSVPVPVPYTRSFTDLPFLIAAALAAVIMLTALSRHPGLAVVPAVLGFGGLLVLGVDGPVTGTALSGGFALAVLIFLLVAAPPAGRRRVTAVLSGGVLIAATVLVVGVVHPGRPYNPRADVHLPLIVRVSQDPMAMLSALLQTPRIPVLTAQLSGALLAEPRDWVLLTYDSYNGASWQAPGNALPAVTAGKAPDAIGIGTASVVTASPVALLPHPASLLNSSPAGLGYAPGSELLAAPQPIRHYSVRVSVGVPTAAQLSGAALPSGAALALTSVPSCVPAALRTLARDVSASVSVPGEQLLRLQQFFSSAPFRYDKAAAPGEGCASINNMLARRKGTSAQFATAFAMTARLLGIPVRVAVGFLPGAISGDIDTVTDADAYAWPQAELTGAGWVDFDPTPKSKSGGHQPAREKQPAIQQLQKSAPRSGPVGAPVAEAAPRPVPGLSVEVRVLLAAAAVVSAALFWVLAVWLWGIRRRARRRRLADPAMRALGAWYELLVPLGEAGVRVAGRSAPAVATDAAALLPAQAWQARELATLAERALYDQVTEQDADVAWQLSDRARPRAQAAAGRRVRLRRALIPSRSRGYR